MGLTEIGSRASPVALPLDYQRIRHGWLARIVRAGITRAVVGPNVWPLVFSAPGPQDSSGGVSPHLYVHLPFCRQICPHCPYAKVLLSDGLRSRYGQVLRREIEAYLARGAAPLVRSLYFGGGTPTATPDLIAECLDLLRPRLTSDAEVGVEVHPADATPVLLAHLRSIGVNRVSLGVETFRPELLRKLGRTYTPAAAEQAIRDACAASFDCVDVNLICAIPGQPDSETADDAARCLQLGADQVSAYTLFTFIHTPMGRGVSAGRVPVYGDVDRIRALRAISQVCRNAGFVRTSPWNFTRPGVAPYSTVTHEEYVGFGAGAASKVDGVFWFNTFSVQAYAAQASNRPALVLQADERVRRFHFLYWQFYRMVVDPKRYRDLFERDLINDFGLALKILRFAGLMRSDGPLLRVTERGAIWGHRLQQLFSITYIDKLWDWSRREAWPRQVVLD